MHERGLTQERLAELTGIRRTEINAYCKGRKRLGGANGPKIAKALGLPDDYFNQLADAPRSDLAAELEALRSEFRRVEARMEKELGLAHDPPQAAQS